MRGIATEGMSTTIEQSGAGMALVELKQALEARYLDLSQHGDRVAHYCAITAVEMGMSSDEAERVGLAGAMHDIGKSTLDEEILLRPGPPTPEQWDHIKQHPAAGHVLLKAAGLDEIATWVLHHHERIDGLGYPDGLEADQIPLEAKILAVVDAYDAMVTDRVYRAARQPHAAVDELRDCAGTQFDPVVVEAFVRALRPSWSRPAASVTGWDAARPARLMGR